jgi:putative transposase
MGFQAIYPKPNTSKPHPQHEKYPYLLRDYLVAIIDWHSRYVLLWRLSNTLDTDFCVEALREALSLGRPEVFNTDQGCQFTAAAWKSVLKDAGVLGTHQHGWQRACFRQRLRGTLMAEREIRRHLPQNLPNNV